MLFNVVKLHVFMFLVPCCDVHYDLHVLCTRFIFYFIFFVLVSNTISMSDDVRVV